MRLTGSFFGLFILSVGAVFHLQADVAVKNKRHAMALGKGEQAQLQEHLIKHARHHVHVDKDDLHELQNQLAKQNSSHDGNKTGDNESVTSVGQDQERENDLVQRPKQTTNQKERQHDDTVIRKHKKPVRRIHSTPGRLETAASSVQTEDTPTSDSPSEDINTLNGLPQEMQEIIAQQLDAHSRHALSQVSRELAHLDGERTVIIDMAKAAGRDRKALYRLLEKSANITLRHVSQRDMKELLPHMSHVKILTIQSIKENTLRTKRGDVVAKLIAQSPQMKNLRKLVYVGNLLSDSALHLLVESQYLSNLIELDLHVNRLTDQGIGFLAGSAHMKNLRVLNLSANKLHDQAMQNLANSSSLHNLEVLNISNNFIKLGGVQALAASKTLQRLIELNLAGNDNIGDSGMQALAESETLEKLAVLSMRHTGLTSEAVVHVAQSAHLKNLVFLNVGHNYLTNDAVIALAQSQKRPQLAGVVMDRGEIKGDAGMKALAKSELCRNLDYLNLADNPIGNKGIIALTASPFAKLKFLSLENCQVSDKGGEALAAVTTWTALETLNLNENRLSKAMQEKIQKRFPFATFEVTALVS